MIRAATLYDIELGGRWFRRHSLLIKACCAVENAAR